MHRRVILHVDMDAFYASVEQRDNPALRGKPVIVGGRSRRGVVSTCSYEARPYGVHSAMPMAQALRLCPHAVVVPGRMARYVEVSEQLMEVLRGFSPQVEPLSLDEAFLEMSGAERLFGLPRDMAAAIRAAVFRRTALTCSVGAAKNKFLAKLASDMNKPDGVTVVPFGDEQAFIAPLPVRRLWGVGPKAAEQLCRLGLLHIGDIAAADADLLCQQLGERRARQLLSLARGQDSRAVVGGRQRKSVGSERTLEYDLCGRQQIEPLLRQQCLRVCRLMRTAGFSARGVRVKLRHSDGFRLRSRQQVLPLPYDDSTTMVQHAFELLGKLNLRDPVRLVGAAAFQLRSAAPQQQLDMFSAARENPRQSKLEHAMDQIRSRFGDKVSLGEADDDERHIYSA